MNHSK